MTNDEALKKILDAIAALKWCAATEMPGGCSVIVEDQVKKLEEAIDILDRTQDPSH